MRKPVFEAGFQFESCFSRADVLVPVKGEWDIVEVKSGTKVKDVNVHDVSFQKYVYENKGLKIRKCFLLHLNNEYVRKGNIDLNTLFVKEDITSDVETHLEGIKERIDSMLRIISSKEPDMKVGKHCSDPYECPVCHCWEKMPENHVFCLYRGGKLSCQLFEDGIEAIKDIPEDIKLSDKQGIQKECAVSGKPHIHKESIKHFLKTLKYPIHYLDFETFSTAIPMFDGLKPYSQVPFQFSLHVVKKEGAEPEHYEFLYDGNGDPRKDFIKMELSNAKQAFQEIKEFHGATIAPLLNCGSLVVGSTYSHPLNIEGLDRVEFEVKPFGTASHVSATRPQAPNNKWGLKIYPSNGGAPFRIEEDGKTRYAHVNTADHDYDHVRLKIPSDKVLSYGVIGSAVAGYYEPECDKNLPELLKGHIDSL